MQITATAKSLLDWQGGTLAIGITEEATDLTGEVKQLDDKLSGLISELIADEEFKGKSGSTASTRLSGNDTCKKLILVGLGTTEEITTDGYRSAAAAIARLAAKDQNLGISLPVEGDAAELAQAITEGIHLALHQDNRFKSDAEDKAPKLENIELLGLAEQATAISKGEIMVSGVILARELVNAPANSVTPITMAETAQAIATDYGLDIKILEQADCEQFEQGMGAYLGVGQASDIPPKFIHLIYKPAGTAKRKVAIVGKSLTFDSGGLNLKPSNSGIETMKMDMGGGAATLGAAKAIAQLKPEVEVHFICAATENMISGKAMHPGDIQYLLGA